MTACQDGRHRQAEGHQHTHGPFQRVAEGFPIQSGSLLGNGRQERRPDGRADECLGNLHDHPADRQGRDGTRSRQTGGQVVTGDKSGLDEEHGDQARADQPEHLRGRVHPSG